MALLESVKENINMVNKYSIHYNFVTFPWCVQSDNSAILQITYICVCVCVIAHAQEITHLGCVLETYICFFICESRHSIYLNSDKASGPGFSGLMSALCTLTVLFLAP